MCFLVLIEKIEAPSLHTFNVEATLIDWPLYFKVLGLTLGPRQLLHLFIKWLILPFSCCSVPVSWCMYEPPCRDTGGLGRTAVPGRAPHWHARCRAIELIPAGPVQWKCTGVKQYADKVRTQSAVLHSNVKVKDVWISWCENLQDFLIPPLSRLILILIPLCPSACASYISIANAI